MASPIMVGEDGAPLANMGQGFEFGIDPSEDPELAMVGIGSEESGHNFREMQ